MCLVDVYTASDKAYVYTIRGVYVALYILVALASLLFILEHWRALQQVCLLLVYSLMLLSCFVRVCESCLRVQFILLRNVH
jgi:hypothetical protein